MAKKIKKNIRQTKQIFFSLLVLCLVGITIFFSFFSKPKVLISNVATPSPTPYVDIALYQDNPQQTIMSGGLSRSFYVQLPRTLPITNPVPVIIAFHGRGDSGAGMYSYSRLKDIDETRDFLVIYPDAYQGDSYNDGRHWSIAESNGVDDIKFTTDILDSISQYIPIDQARIYAIGFSAGGHFTHRLICEQSSLFNGFAVVAAGMSSHLFDTCYPSVKRPIILIGGTIDINFTGGSLGSGIYINSAQDTAKRLASVSHCATTDPLEGSAIRITNYSSCDDNAKIGLVELKGLDHDWFFGDGSAEVFDTATTIMQFFGK